MEKSGDSMPQSARDKHFMQQALGQAEAALDAGEFPVGCVIAFGDELLAVGSRQNSGGSGSESCVNELDHAEIVALRSLYERQRQVDFAAITVYSTMEPCLMCYSTLLVNGIRRIVYAYEDAMGGGTSMPLASLAPLYRDMAVEVIAGVMRQQSLDLFKKFFSLSGGEEGEDGYLQQSYLARYTLMQR